MLHRYDNLRNYSNERSLYLAQLRDSIEEPWQQWELSHFDVESYKSKTVEQVLSGCPEVLQRLYVNLSTCDVCLQLLEVLLHAK